MPEASKSHVYGTCWGICWVGIIIEFVAFEYEPSIQAVLAKISYSVWGNKFGIVTTVEIAVIESQLEGGIALKYTFHSVSEASAGVIVT